MDAAQLEYYYSKQLDDLISILEKTNWQGLESYLKAQDTYSNPWLNIEKFIILKEAAEAIIN